MLFLTLALEADAEVMVVRESWGERTGARPVRRQPEISEAKTLQA